MNYLIRSLLTIIVCMLPVYIQAASLEQFTATDTIDEFSMRPVGSKKVFSTDDPAIWATAILEEGDANTIISAAWLYREENGDQIYTLTRNEIKAEGSRFVAFQLSPSEGKTLPIGHYQVRFYINEVEAGFVNFSVIDAKSSTQQSPASDIAFTPYNDTEGRFTLEVPKGWSDLEMSDPNMVIYQTLNSSETPLARVALSVFKANLTPEYTAKSAVLTMRGQLVKEGNEIGANLEKDDLMEENDGLVVWALKFTYTTSSGKAIEDRKMIMYTNNQIFVFNFINESDYSDTMKKIAMHIVDSLVVTQ